MSDANPLNATKYELHFGNNMRDLNTKVIYGYAEATTNYDLCKSIVKILVKSRDLRKGNGNLLLEKYRGCKFSDISKHVVIKNQHQRLMGILTLIEGSTLGVTIKEMMAVSGLKEKTVRNHIFNIRGWGIGVMSLGGSRYTINYRYKILDVEYEVETHHG